VNVEYNQLGPMLKNTGRRKGDVADWSGYSPYPGNCNVFILEMSTYCKILESSKGLMPEFVNPKFKDKKKTEFKKPTRLECMMQDYPKLLGPEIPVGMTQGERFYCLEPVKNNIRDAKLKLRKTGVAECAASGEFAIYKANRRFLEEAGIKFESDKKQDYSGITVTLNTKVVLFPAFGVTLKEMKDKIHGKVQVSPDSTLILDGDIDIYNLKLDGALLVKACPGAKVTIKNLSVKNSGIFFKAIDPDDEKVPEQYRIRGYTPKRRDILELKFQVSGQYVVDDSAELKSIVL
jgi:UDP-sugar pyrophosphorylase